MVTPDGAVRGDVVVENGRISAVMPETAAAGTPASASSAAAAPPADRIIDVSGCHVLPGGIDVHTHLDLDAGIARSSDDWYTGTVAAAHGGTTTVVDHPAFGPKGCSVFHQIDAYHDLAGDKAVIDYSFHGVIQRVDDGVIEGLEGLKARGVVSAKVYLTYDFRVGDRAALRVLERMKEIGGITAFHCENHGIVTHFRERFAGSGDTSPRFHALSRPHVAEAEAVARVIRLAEAIGDVPVYVVHLSSASGLEEIRRGVDRGVPVFAETCPQYLLLDDSEYERPGHEGLKHVMSPPLREKEDSRALWDGLADGTIQVVGTDHCPFYYEQKLELGGDSFLRCPNGIPGIEARMALLYSEGMRAGRISLEQFVDVTSTNPAKIMGLYPRKGAIEPGADADIVVFDPNREETITHALLHERVDYTPYEGIEVHGFPVLTMRRGEVIVDDGALSAEAGSGTYIPRRDPVLSPQALRRS